MADARRSVTIALPPLRPVGSAPHPMPAQIIDPTHLPVLEAQMRQQNAINQSIAQGRYAQAIGQGVAQPFVGTGEGIAHYARPLGDAVRSAVRGTAGFLGGVFGLPDDVVYDRAAAPAVTPAAAQTRAAVKANAPAAPPSSSSKQSAAGPKAAPPPISFDDLVRSGKYSFDQLGAVAEAYDHMQPRGRTGSYKDVMLQGVDDINKAIYNSTIDNIKQQNASPEEKQKLADKALMDLRNAQMMAVQSGFNPMMMPGFNDQEQ